MDLPGLGCVPGAGEAFRILPPASGLASPSGLRTADAAACPVRARALGGNPLLSVPVRASYPTRRLGLTPGVFGIRSPENGRRRCSLPPPDFRGRIRQRQRDREPRASFGPPVPKKVPARALAWKSTIAAGCGLGPAPGPAPRGRFREPERALRR